MYPFTVLRAQSGIFHAQWLSLTGKEQYGRSELIEPGATHLKMLLID